MFTLPLFLSVIGNSLGGFLSARAVKKNFSRSTRDDAMMFGLALYVGLLVCTNSHVTHKLGVLNGMFVISSAFGVGGIVGGFVGRDLMDIVNNGFCLLE